MFNLNIKSRFTRLAAIAVLFTFCLTQSGFVYALRPEGGRSNAIGQLGADIVTAGATEFMPYALGSITIGGTGSSHVISTLPGARDLSPWMWIGGLTDPKGGTVMFSKWHRTHWPTVQAFTANPANKRVQKWMGVSLKELAQGIEQGRNEAVAAAILRDFSFCATRGEAPSLAPEYEDTEPIDIEQFETAARLLEENGIAQILDNPAKTFADYAGGRAAIAQYLSVSWDLKRFGQFVFTFKDIERQNALLDIAGRMARLIQREENAINERNAEIATLTLEDQEIIRHTLVQLKDIAWNIENDVLDNVNKVAELGGINTDDPASLKAVSLQALRYLWSLTMLFNGIDYRMETRGRDSLGVSIITTFANQAVYEAFLLTLDNKEQGIFRARQNITGLGNKCIIVRPGYNESGEIDPQKPVSVTFIYKVADIIGFLGDNTRAIRFDMIEDPVFQKTITRNLQNFTATLHSRWASSGIVSIPNTHPQDNRGQYGLADGVEGEYGATPLQDGRFEMTAQLKAAAPKYGRNGTILVVLNGDIDNYNANILTNRGYFSNLTADYVNWAGPWQSRRVNPEITTDTKLIPLRIEHYLMLGYELHEAVQRAARDFAGSFAIQVQSDLEPGKIFLAMSGTGQGLYVGISPDGFHPASETYGFVDLTQSFVRVRSGDIFVIDQSLSPDLKNLKRYKFDGTEVSLTAKDIERTTQTTRDVNLRGYLRFFAAEVAAAPAMFGATILGKTAVVPAKGSATGDKAVINLSEQEFPAAISEGLREGRFRRIVFTGMGTAHAACEVMAQALQDYLSKSNLTKPVQVQAALAPDFNAFGLKGKPEEQLMKDTLVIIVSQSGKTADTNQALNAAIERGATPLGIINARESDAGFLIKDANGGVMFTGTGRDIEIAVASTKAYYAQIGAGIIYAMKIAQDLGVADEILVDDIKELHKIPEKMAAFERSVSQSEGRHSLIQAARFFPLFKSEWAVVGSGPAEASAHEAIIKMSELCYRCFFATTIANIKHVNFSAEPWVLVLAANVHGANDFVQANLKSELEKMAAHTMPLTLVTTEDDHRFDGMTTKLPDTSGQLHERPIDIIRVPSTTERFAPIFLTQASHLLAYYIAQQMNERGMELNKALNDVIAKRQELEESEVRGADIINNERFSLLAHDRFSDLYQQIRAGIFNTGVRNDSLIEFANLLAFITGDMDLSNTAFYLGKDLTAEEALDQFQKVGAELVRRLTRTIDTIAHQAKYVTVGTKDTTGDIGGDVGLFVETMQSREPRLDGQTLLELAHGYQSYITDSKPWVSIVPDPVRPLERSILLTIADEHVGVLSAASTALSDMQMNFDEHQFGDAVSDGQRSMNVVAIPINRPFTATRELGLEDAVRAKIDAAAQASGKVVTLVAYRGAVVGKTEIEAVAAKERVKIEQVRTVEIAGIDNKITAEESAEIEMQTRDADVVLVNIASDIMRAMVIKSLGAMNVKYKDISNLTGAELDRAITGSL